MRRIVIAAMGTLSGLVLVFSYDTSLGRTGGGEGAPVEGAPIPAATASDPAPEQSQSPSASDSPSDGQDDGQNGGQDPSASPSRSGQGQKNASVSGTFTGNEVNTRWGIVQVQIVVKNKKIMRASAIKYPDENEHDKRLNAWALPQLQNATISSNGTRIDTISGATVTSDGYKQSLQSAMDQAHL